MTTTIATPGPVVQPEPPLEFPRRYGFQGRYPTGEVTEVCFYTEKERDDRMKHWMGVSRHNTRPFTIPGEDEETGMSPADREALDKILDVANAQNPHGFAGPTQA